MILSITTKYSQTKKGLVFDSRLWILLTVLVLHPSHHCFSYFFCLLYIDYACMYGCINSLVGTYQAIVQRESFTFCRWAYL